MTLEMYLKPTEACPKERPGRNAMQSETQALHDALDARARAEGVPFLHPDGPAVTVDLLGGGPMVAWQTRKGEATMLGERTWSDLPQIYGRYATEAGRALAQKVATLEAAAGVVLTDCGMQAVALCLDVLTSRDGHALVSRQVYNKSKAYLNLLGEHLNLNVELLDEVTPTELQRKVQPHTCLVFAETFTNPLLRALDPPALGQAVVQLRRERASDLRLVIDHTIATPWGLKQPLLATEGIDAVVSAGTKALGGQDQDLWGYVASTSVPFLNRVMDLQAMRGGTLSWRVAQAVNAGLAAAETRFRQRCASAERISSFLAQHPQVEEVYYPRLPTHPDHAVARAHYHAGGSLISFRLRDADEECAGHFCDVLATTEIVRYALSFDGLATKVNHHKTVSEYFTPDPLLRKQGIDRVIRLAVGVEHPDDVIACLNWALWHHPNISAQDVKNWQNRRRDTFRSRV